MKQFFVVFSFVACMTSAYADADMADDPNAIGIFECVEWNGSEGKWLSAGSDCSSKGPGESHNYHATKAVCKKFPADAYYKKWKNGTIELTNGVFGYPLPDLIEDEYILRCVATECEDGYELARDENGNSQGWCRRKRPAPVDGKLDAQKSGDVASELATEAEQDKEAVKPTPTTQKSSEVFGKIDKFLENHFTESSVWKNSDGGFNTARLASDSIAGVVLGTAGGVITSKIVKKNQIKNGFEKLKCTIAGQDVATYGDEFMVDKRFLVPVK